MRLVDERKSGAIWCNYFFFLNPKKGYFYKEVKMQKEVYEALADHLDSLPTGFPRTETGVEMRILRRLFTPEDAKLAVHLTSQPRGPEEIATHAGISVETAAVRLQEMENKGLIMSMPVHGKLCYLASQYVPGFWEAQINRLTPELVEEAFEYGYTFLHPDRWRKAPLHRVVSIHKNVSVQDKVMPYEMAEEIMKSQQVRAVMNCICKQGMGVIGNACDKPEEVCMIFGPAAEYMTRMGRARKISLEEGLDILKQADEAGLVLQPDNAKDPFFMCACCGCCCGILRSLKRDPKPGKIVSTPFVACLDSDECIGCGECEERCTMDAFKLVEEKAVLDADRCIGCGLCVSTCPANCISLERKPQSEQTEVPEDHMQFELKTAQALGKANIGELVEDRIKSKLDRVKEIDSEK